MKPFILKPMKKIVFLLGLSLVLSTWASPTLVAQAAQLQTQVVNLNNRTLPKNGVRIPFIQVNLRAIDGPVEIQSLVVSRTGLSTNEDFGRIWAETDQYKRSTSRRLTNDDQVELEFRTPLIIKPEQTQRLTIYANLEFEAGGRTAALNLVEINHNGVKQSEPEPATETEKATPSISLRQVPVFTQSRSQHDRRKFKISCKNQVCQLVPRR